MATNPFLASYEATPALGRGIMATPLWPGIMARAIMAPFGPDVTPPSAPLMMATPLWPRYDGTPLSPYDGYPFGPYDGYPPLARYEANPSTLALMISTPFGRMMAPPPLAAVDGYPPLLPYVATDPPLAASPCGHNFCLECFKDNMQYQRSSLPASTSYFPVGFFDEMRCWTCALFLTNRYVEDLHINDVLVAAIRVAKNPQTPYGGQEPTDTFQRGSMDHALRWGSMDNALRGGSTDAFAATELIIVQVRGMLQKERRAHSVHGFLQSIADFWKAHSVHGFLQSIADFWSGREHLPQRGADNAGSGFPTTQVVTEEQAVAQGGGSPPAPCAAAGTAAQTKRKCTRKAPLNKVGVEMEDLEDQGAKANSKQAEPATAGRRKRTHSFPTDEIVKEGRGKVGKKEGGVHTTKTKQKRGKVGFARKKDVVEVKKERTEQVQRPPGRKEENVYYVKHIREYRCNEEGTDEFKIRWWYYETDSEDTWETVESLKGQPLKYYVENFEDASKQSTDDVAIYHVVLRSATAAPFSSSAP
eukprot:gene31852-7058_t